MNQSVHYKSVRTDWLQSAHMDWAAAAWVNPITAWFILTLQIVVLSCWFGSVHTGGSRSATADPGTLWEQTACCSASHLSQTKRVPVNVCGVNQRCEFTFGKERQQKYCARPHHNQSRRCSFPLRAHPACLETRNATPSRARFYWSPDKSRVLLGGSNARKYALRGDPVSGDARFNFFSLDEFGCKIYPHKHGKPADIKRLGFKATADCLLCTKLRVLQSIHCHAVCFG